MGPPRNPPGHQARPAESNDLDLIASVIRAALDPGYVLIGPAEHVYIREPGTKHDVAKTPTYEADAVTRLLRTGHLKAGEHHTVSTGSRQGPARAVLITAAARAMVRRWDALHPLR